jgi:hypothetical protein
LTPYRLVLYSTGMDIVREAQDVIAAAESKLRDLLDNGVEHQMYGDVAEVAKMAQAVAAIRGTIAVVSPSEEPAKAPQLRDGPSTTQSSVRDLTVRAEAAPTARDYPRYQRDGDRLVKIGWSKKNRSEYEHKAPFDVIAAFCSGLRAALPSSGSRSFMMDDVLPLEGVNEENIPDYQAYLVLGWLRRLGVVEKTGRHSYTLVEPSWLNDGLEDAWANLADPPEN